MLGKGREKSKVPQGRLKSMIQPRVSRPFGTEIPFSDHPGVKTPGYFRASLRDNRKMHPGFGDDQKTAANRAVLNPCGCGRMILRIAAACVFIAALALLCRVYAGEPGHSTASAPLLEHGRVLIVQNRLATDA